MVSHAYIDPKSVQQYRARTRTRESSVGSVSGFAFYIVPTKQITHYLQKEYPRRLPQQALYG